MANNQIMVNMKFQADTAQAKAKMQELYKSLAAIGQVSNQSLPMNQLSNGLERAKMIAAQLQVQLQSAFNQNTGKLDLSRFIQQMNQSNMSLEKYKMALSQAGPVGQQAFTQLAMSVASADMHVIRVSERVAKLGRTLANTFRWQISSAVLMGVTSTISEAYQFAQDLNESLNNIRIVTGNSADEMKRFAEEANKAAKILNTTTTKYTDASLIYFQQGLNEQQVKERTDLTIKMANVTGQSVQEVADQLTAVWNNFDDGTKSLEHYVDVMTALGAATASSSKEISEGLNKFAAVAETVGLSYEYAASALATVTATTRQSADVVGTAFKTLFARIQDLELGETLDDGTTMGQYSQALAAVGINIKDVNGEVKDMNTILDEMGAKWTSLSKDTQIALAQNVAGVRQYTQLIALMDNWNFFKENLKLANESTGALQEQAEIYSESWKAARNEVTAALEDIYKTLLDDDAFISILHFFADFIENINDVIDSVGGLRGVILLLTTALVNMTRVSMANWMSSLGTSMMSMTKIGRAHMAQVRDQALSQATSVYDESSPIGTLQNAHIKNKVQLERDSYELSKNLTEQEKATLQILKEQLNVEQNSTEEKLEQLALAEKESSKATYSLKKSSEKNLNLIDDIAKGAYQSQMTSNVYDQVGMDNDVNYVNMKKYLSGDLSDASLEQASSATNNIISQMEALKFGVDGADAELIEMFGQSGYDRLNNYYQKILELAQEIEKIKNTPLEQRESQMASREQEVQAEQKRQQRINEIENDPSIKRTKKGGINKSTSAGKEYARLKEESEEYNKQLKIQNKVQNEASNASKELAQNITDQNAALDANVKTLTETQQGNDKFAQSVNDVVVKNRERANSHYDAATAVGKDKEALDKFNTSSKELVAPIAITQRLTSMASMAMTAAMAIQSLRSVVEIWNNDDASFGDKMLQTAMSLGMVIPMLTTSFSKLNIAKMFGLTLDSKGLVMAPKKVAADGTEVAATGLKKIAYEALNGTLFTTIALYGALILAVALVIGGIYLLTRAQEKEKTAAEKAAETHKQNKQDLEALNEELERAQQNLEEVKTLLDSYKEVSNTFDSLIKGSSEWNENLYKHNEIIGQLLKKYPELIEMGVIGYDDQGFYSVLDEALLQQYTEGVAAVEMLEAQIGQTVGTINANKSALELTFAKRNQTLDTKSMERLAQLYVDDIVKTLEEGVVSINGHEYSDNIDNIQTGLHRTFKNMVEGGESFQDIVEELEALYGEKGKDYAEAAFKFVADYKELSNEEIKTREAEVERLKKQTEALYVSLAQSMLSRQKGFTDLNNAQTQAATMMLAKRVEGFFDSVPTYTIAKGVGVSDDFANTLAKFMGLEGETGWDSSQDMAYNLEKSTLGQQVVDKYFEETYGQPLDAFGEDVEWSAREIKFKLEDGSEKIVSLATIISNTLTDAAYELSDMGAIMARVSEMSKEQLALVTLNFTELTEEEMQKIGTQIIPGDASSGYVLSQEQINKAIRTRFGDDRLSYSVSSDGSESLSREGMYWRVSPEERKEVLTYIADLQTAAKDYNAALQESLKMQQDFQRGNQLISESAEKYDLDADTIENYAKSLYNANKAQGVTYESAAKLAVMNTRLSKGIKSLRSDWSNISETLNSYSKDSYEWIEAATEVSKSLEDMFGVAVSIDFIDTYQEQISALVHGGEDAVEVFQELEYLAGRDYILSLNIDDQYKAQFSRMLDELTQQESDGITIGINGEISDSYRESINELLRTGALTADEVNSMFNSIGWDPNLTFETVQSDPQIQEQKIYEYDEKEGEFGTKPVSWQRIETTTSFQRPVLGDITSAPKQMSSVKTNTASGGSSSSSKKKKKSEEVERYHMISEELSDLEQAYDKIAKAKDRAFGKSKLAYLKQEQEATQNLIIAQERYNKEIESYLAQDREKLSEYGVEFTEDNRIANYDKVYEANIDQYNWAVDQHESFRMSDKQFEEYEKEYEEFVKDIQQYEDTLNLSEEQNEKFKSLQDQLLDQQLEEIEYSVDLDIELAEDAIKTLQYQIDNLGDSWDDLADKVKLYGEALNHEAKKILSNQGGLKDILGLSITDEDELKTILSDSEKLSEILEGKTFTADQISKLQEYRNNLIDSNKSMRDMRDTIQNDLVTAFNDWNGEMDDGIDSIDRLSGMIQNYRDIIDLVGKDNLGISNDLLTKMNQTNVEVARQSLESSRISLESNKQALAEAQQKYIEATTEEDKKFWQDTIDTIQKEVEQGEEEFLSKWQASLQAAVDSYADAVSFVMETFEEAISGIAGSFDELQNKYSQQKTINDRYLDDYEKIYNLSKLTRDITKSIDETDSLKAKKELRDLQEEIYQLQESGAEMTQYEVDELQARYDLRLAEIALEEAQNAKSQVRMQRDSEGNWGYVYTADEVKVNEAEQNYEDKLYAYQQLTQNRIDEMTEQMIGLPQEFANAMTAIANDMSLTEEQRQAKLEETTKFYESQYKYLGEQLGIATDDAKQLYENDWTDYAAATGYKIGDNEKWVDSFNETIFAQITGYSTVEEAQAVFKKASTDMLSGLNTAYSSYSANIDASMDAAGTSVKDFSKVVDEETDKIEQEAKAAGDEVSDLAKDGQNGFKGLVNAADEWLDDYQEEIKSYLDENDKWINSIGAIINKYAGIVPALDPVKKALEDLGEQANGTAANVNAVLDYKNESSKYHMTAQAVAYDSSSDYFKNKNSNLRTFNASDITSLERGKEGIYQLTTKDGKTYYLSDSEAKNMMNLLGVGKESAQSNMVKIDPQSYWGQDHAVVIFGPQTEVKEYNGKKYYKSDIGLYYTEDQITKGDLQLKHGGDSVYKIKDSGYLFFDTGGYTGSWGPEGRVAMLHQKEIVLNAQDTENFLAAINIVRDIASMIDLQAAAQRSTLSMISSASVNPTTQTLQQEVTIHAEFPNATQRTEIEAAFDTLLNRASQFANRKNK